MTSRKPLVAANWKENPLPVGWSDGESVYRAAAHADVVVFPMNGDIPACIAQGLVVGSQWVGSRSMMHLKNEGCTYVLCGHSDRRTKEHETDAVIMRQMQEAIEAGLHPILCIGESMQDRAAGKQNIIVQKQIIAGTNNYERTTMNYTLAYEPVWAIGTGKTASPADAQEMHAFIRSLLPQEQQSVRILYGGSVKFDNAADLIMQPDIDGFLVGKASLDPKGFRQIVDACPQ